MTIAPPLEQEHDWAVMGGLANGLAGPGAGIATAVNAQIENAQIRARNSQLLHETAEFWWLAQNKKMLWKQGVLN